ncbi:hypothetical protein OVO65_08275 [Streptococcus mutans]|jgi:hypothetical protein|nr:hypothetical protein [Streptococcus mutans]
MTAILRRGKKRRSFMNAVTLDSMAFDHFETVGEDYLTGIEGEGLGLGICLGLVGFAAGYSL